MYRPLPPRSNLEHLRKEAKAVLRAVRCYKTEWRLADAQHAVARGYGFPSWPKLKAHVESVAPASVGHRIEAKPIRSSTQDASRDRHRISGTWSTTPVTSTPQSRSTNEDILLSVNVAGDAITFTTVWLDLEGQQLASRTTIQADGQEHPLDGSGTVVRACWINTLILEVTLKTSDQTVGRGQYQLSEDGATLTVSTPEHVVVFERA